MRIDNAQILGDSSLSGSLTVTGGTVIGTASFAITASYALNASTTGTTGSFTGSFTGSLLGTASYALQALTASNSNTASYLDPLYQDVILTGSIYFDSGSSILNNGSYIEMRPGVDGDAVLYSNDYNEYLIVNNGGASTNNFTVGGVLDAENITGSLFGSSSYATTSSYAITASYALNGGGGGPAFPFTGSATITGSLEVTGSSGFFGNMSLTSASSFIDITTQTGSTMGYKIGSSWVVRYDTSRNNFMFGSRLTTYPSITTGNNNFFAGNNAIALGLTSGYSNIAIGFDNSNNEPLRNLGTGFSNIALGRAAGRSITSGSNNIAIGEFALRDVTTTTDNIAIGYGALTTHTRTGAIGIGLYALENFAGNGSEDDYSIAIGYTAGRQVSNGRHVLIGYLAARDMSGATSNTVTAIGPQAGYGLRTSISDTIVGSFAMGWFNSLGSTTSNVAIGYGAMQLASSSRYMVAIGYEAGYQNGTATGTGTNDGSVYIGYTAGRLALGNYNVFLGYGAGSTLTSVSNTFILANSSTNLLITGSFTTKRVDFFGSVNAPSFTGSIQATGSLNFNGSELSTAWTSYTPVWTAASVDPVIGNGTITGQYKVIGKTCFVRGNVAMGSTTTFGSGEWYISMPFTASNADGILMTANLLDNGTAWYNATMNGARAGFNYKAPLQYQNTGGTASDVNATQPFTWTTSDRFIWNGSYEIA